MLQKRRSFGARKVSPPQPTCMSDEQKGMYSTYASQASHPSEIRSTTFNHLSTASASYLSNLRNNRPARPTGGRPLPSKPMRSSNAAIQENLPPRAGSALAFRPHDDRSEGNAAVVNKRFSITHAASLNNLTGRPLVMAPNGVPMGRKVTPPEIKYRESAARQWEKNEAHSLRQALEEMDCGDDETRIHDAAQQEAADLVWRHRNPRLAEQEKTAPYKNPDLPVVKKRYVIEDSGSALDRQKHRSSTRSVSDSSTGSTAEDRLEPLKISKKSSREGINLVSADHMHSSRRKVSNSRRVSSGSSKGVFRNPEDQIYEEPESVETMANEVKQNSPLRTRTQNSLPRGSRPLPEKSRTVPLRDTQAMNRIDIYKNPPSQSRDAEYRINGSARSETPEQDTTPKGRAMEIRSDEIRAATSMKRSDRSPKLPTPTAVSDKPGRPIVSFDPSWRASSHDTPRSSFDAERPSSRQLPARPTSTVSAPVVPTINLPADSDLSVSKPQIQAVPQINLPDDEPTIPSINLPEDEPEFSVSSTPRGGTRGQPVSRPLPFIDSKSQPAPNTSQRPLPSHTQSSPSRLPPSGASRSNNRPSWMSRTPAPSSVSGMRGATALCMACSLPIAGRIVTASGSSSGGQKVRFHPECFTCHHCGTGLECVSFYPEPETARMERLQLNEDDPSQSLNPDTDPVDARFYCHLDFHDLFSPRCASCHTPIEGAVILAAGKAWHEGHFYCAECGDPFSSSSPFVESKGYAYCVGCHTKRTSARCRRCTKQILDEVSVEALGAKWHEECFICEECGGGFGDDGRFFIREIDIELTEKEKRKGMTERKVEERAVCECCEKRRLKSRDVAAFL